MLILVRFLMGRLTFLFCVRTLSVLLLAQVFTLSAEEPGRRQTTSSAVSSLVNSDKAFVDWVRKNAVPFRTVEAGNGFTDLSPIGDIVGESRIVALGEATHGTREFFLLKHRIIEYLASRKGFTVFSIEANMPEAYRLNDFVLRGEGDPKQLLKGMYFWTWDTREVLDLILWMREFNRSGKGHLEFTGFDMQKPTVAMEIVKGFVQRQEPGYSDHVAQIYNDVLPKAKALGIASGPAGSRVDKKRLAAGCAEIVKHLEDRRAMFVTHSKPDDVEWAIQMARVVHQSVQMAIGEKSRDESMADNVKWIAEHSHGAKLVLWAHNGHITYEGYSYAPMGKYLKEMFGSQIVNFGFRFNEGSFRAIGSDNRLHEFTIGPAPDDSLDHALSSTGLPLFALDVRKLPKDGPVAAWAAEPHLSRSIGAVYGGPDDPSSLVDSPVHDMFDVILFVNKTSAAHAN
jgi:erythromycin esterase